ncbi:hypothetical protein IC582_001786 [Cucumis melo]
MINMRMLSRYLQSQDHVSNYIFVDPSLISVGQIPKKLELAICAVD